MTNLELSRQLMGLCRRHICVNQQETELIREAARRIGAMPEGGERDGREREPQDAEGAGPGLPELLAPGDLRRRQG